LSLYLGPVIAFNVVISPQLDGSSEILALQLEALKMEDFCRMCFIIILHWFPSKV